MGDVIAPEDELEVMAPARPGQPIDLDKAAQLLKENDEAVSEQRELFNRILEQILRKQVGIPYTDEKSDRIWEHYTARKGRVEKLIEGDLKQFDLLKDTIIEIHRAGTESRSHEIPPGKLEETIREFLEASVSEVRDLIWTRRQETFASWMQQDYNKALGLDQTGEGVTVRFYYPSIYGPSQETPGQGRTSPSLFQRDVPPMSVLGEKTAPPIAMGDRVTDPAGKKGRVVGIGEEGLVFVRFEGLGMAQGVPAEELTKA